MHTELTPEERQAAGLQRTEDHNEARTMVHAALEACFATPPTAGAVILLNDIRGTRMFNINMDAEELVTTLCSSGAKLADDLGFTDVERVLQ